MPRRARGFSPHVRVGALLALALLAVAGGGPHLAAATPGASGGTTLLRWSADIRAGNCLHLGDLVAPLTDLTIPRGPVRGQGARAIPAAASFTAVPRPLDQLLASDMAITIQQAAAPGRPVIACGAIGGVIDLNGTLTIGLQAQHQPGATGIASLTSTADASGTDVAVFLART